MEHEDANQQSRQVQRIEDLRKHMAAVGQTSGIVMPDGSPPAPLEADVGTMLQSHRDALTARIEWLEMEMHKAHRTLRLVCDGLHGSDGDDIAPATEKGIIYR